MLNSIKFHSDIQKLFGVAQDEDDGVATQEHLADEPVFVDGLGLLRPLASLGHLRSRVPPLVTLHTPLSRVSLT